MSNPDLAALLAAKKNTSAPEVADNVDTGETQAPVEDQVTQSPEERKPGRYFCLNGARSFAYRDGTRGYTLPDPKGELISPNTEAQLAELLEAVAVGNAYEVK